MSVQVWVVRALVAGVVAAATLVGIGAPAQACSCLVGPKGALESANAVFVARVQPHEPRVIGRGGWDFLRHQVNVESVYLGSVAPRVNVDALRGMCGSDLDPGHRYLIGSYGKQRYRIALCSVARPPSEGALTQAQALFGAPYEPVAAPETERTDGATDLDPPAQVVWFPGPVWPYPLAGTVLVGALVLGVWRWRRARS